MNGSIYTPRDCRILEVTSLTPSEKLFRLQLADGTPLGHQPGQFIQVSLLGWGEAPISIASSPTRGPEFELGVRRVGSLTAAMHELQPGDTIGVRGPFGSSFDPQALAGRDLLLIAGGCGLAPVRSLIQYCQDRPEEFGRVTILYGARNPEQIMFRSEIDRWQQTAGFACGYTVDTAEGSGCYDGNIGLITSLIEPLNCDDSVTAVVVGPPVMVWAVVEQLRRKGLASAQIVVSLERQMRCGIGKCGHCAIEHLLCCQDGPVFRLDRIEHIRGAL